jgi:aminopeptidase-like protein
MATSVPISAPFPPVPADSGRWIHQFASELYPICRSITGNGVRETLRRIARHIPLTIHEVPTGAQAFDWTVPREWNIRNAWIKNPGGGTLVDFAHCNLHVVSYSIPVQARLTAEQLRPHLHTIPDHPDWIPYRTSYYKEDWGFCIAHRDLPKFAQGEFEVRIESSLEPGSLTYGECFLPGLSDREILISCHVCHPSLCNDNLSGIGVATRFASLIASGPRRLSYRFLFIPGTIGSIVWLSRNQDVAERVAHGLVLTCIGDAGVFTYKRSRRGDAPIDRAMAHVLRQRPEGHRLVDFTPWGYDERQYCSPGFNLPVGCLMRTEHGCFPEYHTSADNLDFIRPEALQASLEACAEACFVLERDRTLLNLSPRCEPQLGKRGLFRPAGGSGISRENLATLWVLNLSDGCHSLLEIAGRAGLPFRLLDEAAERLEAAGLVKELSGDR